MDKLKALSEIGRHTRGGRGGRVRDGAVAPVDPRAGLRDLAAAPQHRSMEETRDVRLLQLQRGREVAAALCSLSSIEENKSEIADRSISTIISLSLSGDAEVEKQAVCTMANLMEMVELHKVILIQVQELILFLLMDGVIREVQEEIM